ncbi:MAG: DUF4288 domain-containing protein [Byssovorax sp.]
MNMAISRPEWPWFVAEFVIEERSGKRRSFSVHSYLIEATCPDAAYEKALGLAGSLGDAVRNSAGDVVEYVCLGLHNLDTLQVEKMQDGVHLSVIEWGSGPPAARQKSELSLFRS